MSNWFLFAIAAMLLFSVSNTLVKVASDKFDLAKSLLPFALPLLAGIIVFALAALYLMHIGQLKIGRELALLLIGVIVFSLVGVTAFLGALKEGKIAEVTAVLSFSTIVVALISTYFLQVEFTLKEIVAMALAVVSIVLFAL